MIRRHETDERSERARGQGFLFDSLAPPAAVPTGAAPAPDALPDLDRLFDELNRRFFADRLEARLEWSNRMRTSAGSCRPKARVIRISVPYHRRRPAALTVTLAHEMLHLVVPGHGPEFRRLGAPIARTLGVDWREFRYAERFADPSRHRYVYVCPRCGMEFPARASRRMSCGLCGPGRYDEAFRLELAESRSRPGPVLRGERPIRAP